MTDTTSKPAHGLVVPVAAWGHVRPLVHLSLNLLHVHPNLHLTLLLAPSVTPRVNKELQSVMLDHIYTPTPSTTPSTSGANTPPELVMVDPIIDRLQLINVTSKRDKTQNSWTPEAMHEEAMDYSLTLPKILTSILSKQSGFNNKFQTINPSFIMFDGFQTFAPSMMRTVTEQLGMPKISLILFCPSNASALYHHFASEEHGGFIARTIRLANGSIAKGMDELEAYSKYGFSHTGEVKNIPGLPPMYDFEFHPMLGATPIPPGVQKLVAGMYTAAHDQDVSCLIIPSVQELEEEAHAAAEKEMGKPVIMAGLQFPLPIWKGLKPERRFASEDDKKCIDFLDQMEAKLGKKSVLYVSFGSMFFPITRPELVQWLIESLMQHKMPFLFAHASDMAQVSPELLAKIDAHPDGHQVKFAPQWQVLNHSGVGYFLTHCGSNSSAEAVLAGLPLVALPFAADQGEFAAMWTSVYKVAVTLKQPFTFRPDEPYNTLYDGTKIVGDEISVKAEMARVWNDLRGPKGEKMRVNMAKVKETIFQSWKNGKSRTGMESVAMWFYEESMYSNGAVLDQ